MKIKKTAKTIDALEREREREQYLAKICSEFNTKETKKYDADYNKLASEKECKINEYKLEKG